MFILIIIPLFYFVKQLYPSVNLNQYSAIQFLAFLKQTRPVTVLMGMRDDLLRAMKKGEVTIMLLADFSKAFALLEPDSYNQVISTLRFSKSFLRWLNSYFNSVTGHVSYRSMMAHLISELPVWCATRRSLARCYVCYLHHQNPSALVYFNTLTILQSTPATKMCARTKLHHKYCEILV